MRHRTLAFLAVIATVLAACSGAGSTPGPSLAATANAAPNASVALPSAGPARIEVRLTDELRIEPDAITVPAGVPVTFIVTNEGALDHEFYLGDEAAQAAHAQEMQSMGGMTHDEPEGIGVKPGQTKELSYTFTTPGSTLAGCHVQGHYLGGMKATLTIR